MEKGNIIIPINEVWELLNKPHRLIKYIYDEVEKIKVGEYELLNFNDETKQELLDRLKKIYKTGNLLNN
jgi:hypothetical protein